MPKRGAIGELTHLNWDQEEEKEEAGQFKTAKKEEIKKRVIVTAKRRSNATSEVASGVFKSFGGFGSSGSGFSFGAKPAGIGTPSNSTSSSQQANDQNNNSDRAKHLSNLKALNAGVMKWIEEHVNRDPYCILTPVFADYERHLTEIEKRFPFDGTESKPVSISASALSTEKLAKPSFQIGDKDIADKLKKPFTFGSAFSTDKSKIDSNDGATPKSFINFGPPTSKSKESEPQKPSVAASPDTTKPQVTPKSDTFKLQFPTTYTSPSSSSVSETSTTTSATSVTASKLFGIGDSSKSSFQFGASSTLDGEKGKPALDATKSLFQLGASSTTGIGSEAKKSFSFGAFPTADNAESKPAASSLFASTAGSGTSGFSFGNLNKDKPASFSGFNFGTSSNGAAGTSLTGNQGAAAAEAEEEEYVPPKPEVKEIKEEGSVFTIRCKLFYKAEDQWKDKGIGNAYIKPIDSGKFQLLIRADTNLGNILLNIMVTKALPFKQQKTNVSFVCVPSPPINAKKPDDTTPVPMLMRVKTEESAAKFLEEINKNRGVSTE